MLVIGRVLELRKSSGWFSPSELGSLFEALYIPQPANIPRELQALAKEELTLKQKNSKGWSLSPLGKQTAEELVEELDIGAIEVELIGSPGSEFGQALHSVVAPFFAPAKWTPGIARFLQEFPFEHNVFCMTRYPSKTNDPVRGAVDTIREVVDQHGLVFHMASDRQIDDDLHGNVAAHIWACQYGIGIFEDTVERGLNHNLIIEVGAMLMTGRRCALLKDKTIEQLPTDFVGRLYKEVDIANPNEVATATHSWLADDLQLGKCKFC